MQWLMLKSKAGWGQNAKAFIIHLAHQHIVHSYEVNSQWLLNYQKQKVSVMIKNMNQWDILKCCTVIEDESCKIACGWTGFVCVSFTFTQCWTLHACCGQCGRRGGSSLSELKSTCLVDLNDGHLNFSTSLRSRGKWCHFTGQYCGRYKGRSFEKTDDCMLLMYNLKLHADSNKKLMN